jgi:hypothetical protein
MPINSENVSVIHDPAQSRSGIINRSRKFVFRR